MTNSIEGAMPPLPEPIGHTYRGLTAKAKLTHAVLRDQENAPTNTSLFTADQLQAYAAPLVARVAELQADAARWRRLVNASELPFPPAAIADDPENDARMVYGRKRLEALIDLMDEIPSTYEEQQP